MSKKIKISQKKAEKIYGIENDYSIMQTNGEARFRLTCPKDGTAYIRTETGNEAQGLQRAHYHKGLTETYIVQKGHIVFLKYKDKEITYQEYTSGEMFTIKNKVPHNVYMMKNTVIHTVKHGESISNSKEDGADWWDDDEGCKELNSLNTCTIQEIFSKYKKVCKQTDNMQAASVPPNNPNTSKDKEPLFNEAYLHFDKLIWQFPLWILNFMAIGIMIITFLNTESKKDRSLIFIGEQAFHLPTIIGSLILGYAILGLILNYAVYRFRYHQIQEKKHKKNCISPQILLQIFSNILVLIMLSISLSLFGVKLTLTVPCYFGVLLSFTIVLSICLEFIVHKIAERDKNQGDRRES